MIELKQVTKEYGRATVLKNITLTLEEPGLLLPAGPQRRWQDHLA